MSFVKEVSEWILAGVGGIIQSIEEEEINRMVETILETHDRKILLLGSGQGAQPGHIL